MRQIKKIGVIQTAKVVAILYTTIAYLVFIPYGLIQLAPQPPLVKWILIVFAPLLYGILVFILVTLGSLLYNFLASYVGGIEIELTEKDV